MRNWMQRPRFPRNPLSLVILATLGLALFAACAAPAATPTTSRFPTPTPRPPGTPTVTPTPFKQYAAAPQMSIDKNKKYTAIITTSKGTMTAELFAAEAPLTVNNFVFLSREGFYNGVIFHRIVKTFMVQTGDPRGNGSGTPGYRFNDEPVTRNYVKGTLAMANSGPNTNGSQFFIMAVDYVFDPKAYTIFGIVTEGLDTLDKIADTPVRPNPGMNNEVSMPTERVTIDKVEIRES